MIGRLLTPPALPLVILQLPRIGPNIVRPAIHAPIFCIDFSAKSLSTPSASLHLIGHAVKHFCRDYPRVKLLLLLHPRILEDFAFQAEAHESIQDTRNAATFTLVIYLQVAIYNDWIITRQLCYDTNLANIRI